MDNITENVAENVEETTALKDEIVVHNGKIAEIPIEKLASSPLNNFEMVDIEELSESLLHFGLLTPLTVVDALGDGTYEILSGERRYRAAMMLHEKDPDLFSTVPCMVKSPDEVPDDDMKSLLIQLANLEMRTDYNKDEHRFQVITLLNRLCENGTFKRKDMIRKVANSMGMTTRYARMYASVAQNGIEELKDAVINRPAKTSEEDRKKDKDERTDNANDDELGHIPLSLASRISSLPRELQREIIQLVQQGEEAEDALNAVLDKYRKNDRKDPEEEDGAPIANDSYWGSSDRRIEINGGANKPSSYSWNTGAHLEPVKPNVLDDYPDDGYLDEDVDEADEDVEASENAAEPGDDEEEEEYFDELDDLDGIDSLEFLRKNSTDVNLEIDTSRLLNGLKVAKTDDGSGKERDAKIVKTWARRMMRRDTFKGLDDAQMDALYAVMELANYIHEQGLEDEIGIPSSTDSDEE